MKAEQKKASVVVVGAGFAGLEAVRALSDSNVDVTLVDSKNHHCFQPLLYQVATAALSPADVAWPIRSILAGQRNVTVLMSEVKAVDPVARTVNTADNLLLHFDYLILATGVTSSYFNHPEWARYAPGLKTIEDATRIRARILLSFEQAERSDVKGDLTRSLTFIVVGGGPTGVELAGSIADIAHNALAGDFRNINPEKARIILIEAGQRILATFPEELSAYARRSLVDMGVEVITGVAVTDCDADGVSISDGRRIESSCVLWAAGVKASPAASWLGIEADRAGRIKWDEHLRVAGFRSIFAVAILPRRTAAASRFQVWRRLQSRWDGMPACLSPARFYTIQQRQGRSSITIRVTWRQSGESPPWCRCTESGSRGFSVGCSGASPTFTS